MAGDGVHGADWGSVAAAGPGSDPGTVSVPDSRFSFRQRQRIVNHTVARLLNKLLIEQTKSRPRHSNDNGLVETKNGAVIRKHRGYGYIAARMPRRLGDSMANLQRSNNPSAVKMANPESCESLVHSHGYAVDKGRYHR